MARHQKPHTLASTTTTILIITMIVLYGGTIAQSTWGCKNVLMSISSCLIYISGDSSNPTSRCCTQLANMVKSQPQCLCEMLNGGGPSFGFKINQTLVLSLPNACDVETPPISDCNGNSPPEPTPSSPRNSPSETTPSSSPGNPSGSGHGSNNVPSTDKGSSDATSARFTAIPILFSLLFANGMMV